MRKYLSLTTINANDPFPMGLGPAIQPAKPAVMTHEEKVAAFAEVDWTPYAGTKINLEVEYKKYKEMQFARACACANAVDLYQFNVAAGFVKDLTLIEYFDQVTFRDPMYTRHPHYRNFSIITWWYVRKAIEKASPAYTLVANKEKKKTIRQRLEEHARGVRGVMGNHQNLCGEIAQPTSSDPSVWPSVVLGTDHEQQLRKSKSFSVSASEVMGSNLCREIISPSPDASKSRMIGLPDPDLNPWATTRADVSSVWARMKEFARNKSIVVITPQQQLLQRSSSIGGVTDGIYPDRESMSFARKVSDVLQEPSPIDYYLRHFLGKTRDEIRSSAAKAFQQHYGALATTAEAASPGTDKPLTPADLLEFHQTQATQNLLQLMRENARNLATQSLVGIPPIWSSSTTASTSSTDIEKVINAAPLVRDTGIEMFSNSPLVSKADLKRKKKEEKRLKKLQDAQPVGRILNVGPGQEYADESLVPWGELKAGDRVNLFSDGMKTPTVAMLDSTMLFRPYFHEGKLTSEFFIDHFNGFESDKSYPELWWRSAHLKAKELGFTGEFDAFETAFYDALGHLKFQKRYEEARKAWR